MRADLERADLYVVIGSSLRVAPVGSMAGWLQPTCPRVLINLEAVVPKGGELFDCQLLGDCQETIRGLAAMLGWSLPTPDSIPGSPGKKIEPRTGGLRIGGAAASISSSGSHEC